MVVEGFCSGRHRSPHKGFSVEFKEHRPYAAGDEIRHLDWKIFGKTDRLFIREYEDETNVRAHILLDASGSMRYGGSQQSKFAYAQRLAACLAYLLIRQQDAVGLVVFDTAVRTVVPPRARTGHLRALLDAMEQASPGGETALGPVFDSLAPRFRRRSMLLVVSDCFGDLNGLLNALAHFRYDKHDITVFQLWHPDELAFPFQGWTRFDCLEDPDRRLLVRAGPLRDAYLERLETYRRRLQEGCNRHRISLAPLTVTQPYAEALALFLAERMRKR
jgi:uncharacterized protein (DUF58 family)